MKSPRMSFEKKCQLDFLALPVKARPSVLHSPCSSRSGFWRTAGTGMLPKQKGVLAQRKGVLTLRTFRLGHVRPMNRQRQA